MRADESQYAGEFYGFYSLIVQIRWKALKTSEATSIICHTSAVQLYWS